MRGKRRLPDGMSSLFSPYLTQLRATPLEQHTELTGRSALEGLLARFASKSHHRINVQHEPKREEQRGAPDFKVTKPGEIIGYVEVKEIGANLDKVLKSEQIAKYRKLSGNIILTDYLDFLWLDERGVRERARLAHEHELEGRKLQIAPEKEAAVSKLLDGFFSEAPQGIGKAQQLALALATRSQLLRDYLTEELVRQEKDHRKGRLFGLYEVFKAQVFHELEKKEFADAFAQMLAYGLFLAKLNAGAKDKVTLSNARDFIPASFRLIRELVEFLSVLNQSEYRDVRWVVEEVLSIVNTLDLEGIHADLSFRKRKAISRKVRAGDEEEHRLFERDPFIYFYEDFLKAYDKETRKGRGVYYTPPPIVNFIVRAVDDILKETFGIDDGLADHKRVTVLDFACGTGTFLLETFEKVFDNIGGADSGKAALIVREHLLKNLYGFEYLIAPYTIAHLKLSQYLRDKGHPLQEDERLQVFLTNTLEPIAPQPNMLLPAVTEEVQAAQAVKDKPILVIMGNPPYSGHSKNNSPHVKGTIEAYKMVDGKPLGEKNPKWLQDDYVKFIRFAQMKMDSVEEGVVGIITNHAWLDNPTFRGMRASLLNSFEQIHVIDLHGNSKKREIAPDGSKDENVFDIEQGVAISLFIKRKGTRAGVWRKDLWGRRLQKYYLANSQSHEPGEDKPLDVSGPDFNFQKQDLKLKTEYQQGRSVTSIYSKNSVGLVTARDKLAIHFELDELMSTVKRFASLSPEEARIEFSLGKDVRDWKVQWAQDDVRSAELSDDSAAKVLYRPLDLRWTYYTGKSRGFLCYPRQEVMGQLAKDNVSLVTSRLAKGEDFCHAQVTEVPIEAICMSPLTSNNGFVFPSYFNQRENLSTDFRDFVDSRYNHHYTPEEILGYIYAVLHAPAYRRRYAEFLRIDFPRIPFAERKADFDALSALGWTLAQVHLLRVKPKLKLARFHGKGTGEVEAVRYSPEEQAVHINKMQAFAPVPPEVWNFHIGGYQVMEKYLKSRKGRTLSLDEIDHVGHVADALAFTIRQMAEIDTAYAKAFPGRA